MSLAIALAEQGLLHRQPIEIVATDASADAIARAERGSYGPRSFRQLPEHLKAKYFVADGVDRWRPIESVRRSIRWAVANLVVPEEVKRYAACDVIFCRNVFIYFSDDAIRSTVRLFTEYLSPDGFLFVSASESLGRLGVALELAEIGGAFTYVKLGRRDVVEAAKLTRAGATPDRALAHHQGNS